MKRAWHPDELSAQWTLLPEEKQLALSKRGPSRLGFAILLKFFQYEGRFPNTPREVPAVVVGHLAQQLALCASDWRRYDWNSRAIKYHRAEIRKRLGFREATVADGEALSRWLRDHVLAQTRRLEHIRSAACERLRERRIEPPTPERLDRLVRSAVQAFDAGFYEEVLRRLSAQSRERLDALLAPATGDTDEVESVPGSARTGLQELRERLRCKEIWVEGADRYRNPDEDLPRDFDVQREGYYAALQLPLEADPFVRQLKQALNTELAALDRTLPGNPTVKILSKAGGWIKLSPLEAQPEPPNLLALKAEVSRRWPMTNLLDVLKETDLRIGLTHAFRSPTAWENLDRATLQYRLLLCLYGMGTNAGLKRVSVGHEGVSYKELLYVRRRFITKEHLRDAIAEVVNRTLQARLPHIWGEGTTACASDSKQFGAWDQNLMTE